MEWVSSPVSGAAGWSPRREKGRREGACWSCGTWPGVCMCVDRRECQREREGECKGV